MEELKNTAVEGAEEINKAEAATPVTENAVVAEPIAEKPVAEKPEEAIPVAATVTMATKVAATVTVVPAAAMKATISVNTEVPAQATGLVRNNRKVREGIVTSNKMNKTIVVAVRDKVKHPLYKKTINKTTKLKAHDENNDCNIGDIVQITETRPLSKDKRWRLVKIIERAK